jgi:hypothetical protein
MLLTHQRRRQRLVDGLALAERRPPVHRRAHQRMVEPDAALGETRQPGRLGHPERLHAEPERPPGTDDDRRIAGLLGRRRKQHRLGRLREATDSFEEHPLDPGADRQRVGERRPPGELVGIQRRRQLEQRQWIALGGLDQARTNVRREPGWELLGQQSAGGVGIQPGEVKLSEAGGRERVEVVIAGGDQQHDPFGLEPSGSEGQRVGRRLVQPLRIVHQADKWPLLGHLREQAQRAHTNQEAVGGFGGGEPEGSCRAVAWGPGSRSTWPSTGRTS